MGKLLRVGQPEHVSESPLGSSAQHSEGSRETGWTLGPQMPPVMRGARGTPWPGPKVTQLASLPHSRRARNRKTKMASEQPDAWL